MKKYLFLVVFLFLASMAAFPGLYEKVPVLGPTAATISAAVARTATPENANLAMNKLSSLVKGSSSLTTSITDWAANWKNLVFAGIVAIVIFPGLIWGLIKRLFGSAVKNKGLTALLAVGGITLAGTRLAGFSAVVTVILIVAAMVAMYLTMSGPWGKLQKIFQDLIATVFSGLAWLIGLVGSVTAGLSSVNFHVSSQVASMSTAKSAVMTPTIGYLSFAEGIGQKIGPYGSLLLIGGFIVLIFLVPTFRKHNPSKG